MPESMLLFPAASGLPDQPRSREEWRAFVLTNAGPDLIDVMAAEIERQGPRLEPWEILRDLVRADLFR